MLTRISHCLLFGSGVGHWGVMIHRNLLLWMWDLTLLDQVLVGSLMPGRQLVITCFWATLAHTLARTGKPFQRYLESAQ